MRRTAVSTDLTQPPPVFDHAAGASGSGTLLLAFTQAPTCVQAPSPLAEASPWQGRVIMFHRTARDTGNADLWSVYLAGVNERRISTPLDGSDPSGLPLLN